ncbi:hypothetical protein ES703_77504 [subsurface metagenome]
METSLIITWVGMGLLFCTSVGGWIITINRNGKHQAERFGCLEGKVDGLNNEMGGLKEDVRNLGSRIDNVLDTITKERKT